MSGYVKIYRKMMNHWLWPEKRPFTKLEAWIDLIMLMNHADCKKMVDSKPMVIKRGQHLTSELKLADRWNWNRKTVRNFLSVLEKDEMLTKKSSKRWTILTLVNYDVYHPEGPSPGTTKGQLDGQVRDNSLDTNNNYNHLKNEKEIVPFAEIVDYLNLKAGTNYRHNGQKMVEKIQARWNDRFTLEDFKKVIDIKTEEWLNTDQDKYLRPETLFGTKFESYLNQKRKTQGEDDVII